MNTTPWSIIGWLLLIAIGLIILKWMLILSLIAMGLMAKRIDHWKTRNIAPEAGQSWEQGDSILRIERITEKGRIVINTGYSSWSDSPEDWKVRVKNRRLRLISK